MKRFLSSVLAGCASTAVMWLVLLQVEQLNRLWRTLIAGFIGIVALILGGIALKYLIGLSATPQFTQDLVRPLGFVNELALGLILFVIGGVFDVARIKATHGLLFRFSSVYSYEPGGIKVPR